MQNISIIGAGAWGTALSILARRTGKNVTLQARETSVINDINHRRKNSLFLPGHDLDPHIRATKSINESCRDIDALLLVTPAQYLRRTAVILSESLEKSTPIVICSKGIEQGSSMFMSEILHELLPHNPLAVLSGPTFAHEVANNLPTAVTLACKDPYLGKELTQMLATPFFRIYQSTDVIGAEIGGAIKNVLAIACGIANGREMGKNAQAALITRGLAEIIRIAKSKNAKTETLMGLSGIGDLNLTCNALQSRNFSLGIALGQGHALQNIVKDRISIAEGMFSAVSVHKLGLKLSIETPLCSAVHSILNEGANIDEVILNILNRPFISETV